MVTPPAKFLVEVLIEPKPGYDMLRTGGDGYLFMASDDTTQNVLLDTASVADVLQELATGRMRDGSSYGYGRFWRFNLIVSPDSTGGAR